MGATVWHITRYGREPVERIEVIKETAMFFMVESSGTGWDGKPNKPRRIPKDEVFSTFADAKSHLVEKAEMNLKWKRDALAGAEDHLARMKALTEPVTS